MHYILRGKEVVKVEDVIEWAKWFETDNRRVARDVVGEATVSTVFLGLDYRFSGEGPPLLFETMVFGGQLDGETDRYATWEEAEAGHKAIKERALKSIKED